jgi:hypothetical protein
MAKGKKAEMDSKLSSFGDILAKKESTNIPMQQVSPVEEIQTIEKATNTAVKEKDETPFHVYIPTDLLWSIKEIGFKKKKKIKDLFIQALEALVKEETKK